MNTTAIPCSNIDEQESICEMCEGTGEVEEVEYQCDDSTGYNTITMGTGKYIACPECQL